MTRTTAPPRPTWRDRLRTDDGVSLVEFLVASFLMVIVGAMGVGAYHFINGVLPGQEAGRDAHGQVSSTNSILLRDISEAVSIRTATDTQMVIGLIRDGACNIRDWHMDDTALVVTTTFYEGESCSGASETSTKVHIPVMTEATPFEYYNERDAQVAAPVEHTRFIKRIAWRLESSVTTPREQTAVKSIYSSAAFQGIGEQHGTGVQVMRGTAPILTLNYGAFTEGVGNPVLTWTDTSPTVTEQWVVYRKMAPEGAASNQWTQMPTGPLDASTLTWTDTTVPHGYTATYTVVAVLKDGTVGPTSNAVVSGKRPTTVTGLTATGRQTSIDLAWTAAIGATGYDVYRDGVLVKTLGAVTTFTDDPGEHGWATGTNAGYGHSHYYRVVPVNRWEQKLTTGSETGRLPLGAAATASYTGGLRVLTGATSVGANTAPAQPAGFTVTQRTGVGVRVNDLSWTAVTWTGARPVTTSSITYRIQHQSSGAGWADLATLTAPTVTYAHTGRPAGRWTEYRVIPRQSSVQPAGTDGVATGVQREWQRPATPACTTSGATTRSIVVSGSLANTVDETYVSGDFNVRSDVVSTWQGNATAVDPLAHNTSHGFRVRANGAGGWSDEGACSGSTLLLAAGTPTWSSTTRAISASFVATRGSSQNITLEGVATRTGASGSWDPLTHNTNFTITARNSDGHNNVSATATARTQTLTVATPATPLCSVSSSSTYAPATMTVSGGDRIRISGGSWYASPEPYYRSGTGTYTFYAQRTASNTDGHNTVYAYSGEDSCSYTLYTPPPPPPASPPSSGYSSTFPVGCSGISPGSISSSWYANYNGTHYTPDPFVMLYKVTATNSLGQPSQVSWGLSAQNRLSDSNQWTGGVSGCGAQTGV